MISWIILLNVLKSIIDILYFDDKLFPKCGYGDSFNLPPISSSPIPFYCTSLLFGQRYLRLILYFPSLNTNLVFACLNPLSPRKPSSYWGIKFRNQALNGICHCEWGIMASRPFQWTGLGSRHMHISTHTCTAKHTLEHTSWIHANKC